MSEELSREPWWLAGWPRHVSPSALGRVAACPRSEAMPHVYEETVFATRGTVAHKFLADCLEHGRDAALGLVENPEDIEWLEMLDLSLLPAFQRESYLPEVALAYNPRTRTARRLGQNLSRSQARALAADDEVVGIVDVLGETDTDAVAHDYKMGHGWVEPAATNWQLRAYSLFAARWLGKTAATYSVIRARENGQAWHDTGYMDELDLLAFEEELLALLRQREDIRQAVRAGLWQALPALVEGKHCKYCPALWACPAKTAGVRAVLARSDETPKPVTVEDAVEAWRRIRQAKRTLQRWEAVVVDMARQTPLPLGDGEVLGEKDTSRDVLLPKLARKALERQYGALGGAVAGAATQTVETMTKTELRRALKALVLPTLPPDHQKITWLERDVMLLLRQAGAVSVKASKTVCEHVPARAKALAPARQEPPPELPDDEETA